MHVKASTPYIENTTVLNADLIYLVFICYTFGLGCENIVGR